MKKIKSLIFSIALLSSLNASAQYNITHNESEKVLRADETPQRDYKSFRIGDTMPKLVDFVLSLPKSDVSSLSTDFSNKNNNGVSNIKSFNYKGGGIECEFGYDMMNISGDNRLDYITIKFPKDTLYIIGNTDVSGRVLTMNGDTIYHFESKTPKVEFMYRKGSRGLDMMISDASFHNESHSIDGKISSVNTRIDDIKNGQLGFDKTGRINQMSNYTKKEQDSLGYKLKGKVDT